MNIKFIARGTGMGSQAVAYMLKAHDYKGEVRAGIEILRGDAARVARLIDSLSTVHKYTSGVIAWHLEDTPSPAVLQAVLDDFERVAFAGLDADQYDWCAVQHVDDDGCTHVHAIVPRVELSTGRSMNIAPPGWSGLFYHWRDAWNREKGWARPEDPMRARLLQHGRPGTSPESRARQAVCQTVTDLIATRVMHGSVNSRADVVATISELLPEGGEITRQGNDFISVRFEPDARPIKLKGALYGNEFNGDALREFARKDESGRKSFAGADLEASRTSRKMLEEHVRKRACYNKNRYAAPIVRDKTVARTDRESAELDTEVADRVHLGLVLRNGDRHQRVELVARRASTGEGGASAVTASVETEADVPGRDLFSRQSRRKKRFQKGVDLDRDRKNADRAIADAERSIQYATAKANRSSRDTNEAVERCCATAKQTHSSVIRACRAFDLFVASIGKVRLTEHKEQATRQPTSGIDAAGHAQVRSQQESDDDETMRRDYRRGQRFL